MEGDGSRPDEAVLAALAEVMEVMRANAQRAQTAAARAASLRDRRLAGARYADIVAEGDDALALEAVTRNMTDLINAGAKLRRAAARALHSEGLTMEQIAQLFGVTRQRVSALLRPVPDDEG
jgi:DNA-directed RNA polymerase sigma subunit (sigma70/sigma32)